MDTTTLKLMVLVDMVQNLMTRNCPKKRWNTETQSLPDNLNRLSIDELIQVNVIPLICHGAAIDQSEQTIGVWWGIQNISQHSH